MNHNRVISLILLGFIMWWAYLTMGLPETTMVGEPGPKFFPSVLLTLMTIFSVLLFFTKTKKSDASSVKADDVDKDLEQKESNCVPFPMVEALKLFGVFLGGIIIVYFLGFVIGMIMSLTIMLWMIGWRLFPRAILFSSVVTLVTFALFKWLLRIPLPSGTIF